MRVACWLVCAIAIVVGTREARADEAVTKRIVAILEIRGPTAESAATFERDLEKQVATKDFWIAPRAKVRELLRNSTKWADGCVTGPCLAEVKVQTQAELVLLATLTGSGTTFGYVVTLVRTDTGAVLSQASDRCDVCTHSEAQTAATLAVIKLLNDIPDTLPDALAEQGAASAVATKRLERDLEKAKRTPQRLGVGLTVIGLVAAGVGTVMYVTGDKPPAMLATAAAGAGLLVSGVVVLTF